MLQHVFSAASKCGFSSDHEYLYLRPKSEPPDCLPAVNYVWSSSDAEPRRTKLSQTPVSKVSRNAQESRLAHKAVEQSPALIATWLLSSVIAQPVSVRKRQLARTCYHHVDADSGKHPHIQTARSTLRKRSPTSHNLFIPQHSSCRASRLTRCCWAPFAVPNCGCCAKAAAGC